MKRLILILIVSLPLFLSGCENDGKYPISGEDCGPDDPVKTLDASDCSPVPM